MSRIDELMKKSKPTKKILVKALEIKVNRKSHHKLFHFKHHKLRKTHKPSNSNSAKSVLRLVQNDKLGQLTHKQLHIVLTSLAKSRKKLSKRPNTKKFGWTYMYIFKLYIKTAKSNQQLLLKKKINSLMKSLIKRPRSK